MKSDKDSLSFGRYLQAERLDKKISLEKVSEETRIGLGNLLLIEQEDHERLPATVFVKGFIRAYAAAIGADGDDAVRRYESRLNVVKKIAESETAIGKPAALFWWKLLLALLLFFCIIFLSIYAVTFYQHRAAGTQPVAQTLPAEIDQSHTGGTEIQPHQPAEAVNAPAEAGPESLVLQVIALEDTWLKVIIDEKDSTEYSLKAGDQIELEASSGYNLLIGNAGGLKLMLNDQPVSIPGESGQVVNLHLPSALASD
jgi:cytoskeletal protein RodZ